MTQTILFIVILILVGLLLVVFELLTPSFGLISFLALCAFVGAVWLGFTLNSTVGSALIAGLLVAVPLWVWLMFRVLQRTGFGKKLLLDREKEKKGSGLNVTAENETLVGKTGVAETLLRPSGAVRVDGRRFIARAEGGVIDAGETIKVIKAAGSDVVVRRAKDEENVE